MKWCNTGIKPWQQTTTKNYQNQGKKITATNLCQPHQFIIMEARVRFP